MTLATVVQDARDGILSAMLQVVRDTVADALQEAVAVVLFGDLLQGELISDGLNGGRGLDSLIVRVSLQ